VGDLADPEAVANARIALSLFSGEYLEQSTSRPTFIDFSEFTKYSQLRAVLQVLATAGRHRYKMEGHVRLACYVDHFRR